MARFINNTLSYIIKVVSEKSKCNEAIQIKAIQISYY